MFGTEEDPNPNEPAVEPADGGQPAADLQGGAQASPGGVEASSFLDSLMDEADRPAPDAPAADAAQPGDEGRARGPDGRFIPKEGEQPQAQPGQAAPPAAPAAAAPRTPEQEDAELLDGIKSERGRERVRGMIEARREAEGSLGAIRDMVSQAGLTPETFSQQIEFARLANSNNPQDLERAAQMMESARTQIYQRLGRDAPGVDALSDHPDLAQRVQNLEMPRDLALEHARLRRQQAEVAQQQQADQRFQQDQQQFNQSVQQGQSAINSYLQSRAHEADHPVRLKAVQDYFAKPGALEQFAQTYQPQQWPAAVRLIYDNVHVAQPRRQATAPISARTSAIGTRTGSAAMSHEERTMNVIDSLGIG